MPTFKDLPDDEARAEDGDVASSLRAPLLPQGHEAPAYNTITPTQKDICSNESVPDPELALGSDQNTSKGVYGVLSILLLGVFVSQTDQSLVMATYGKVSSEFHDFDSGSWLVSAYILSQCVAQPLYGKLSDIYGRKRCLQASYAFFALGTLGCGLGQTLYQVIIARAVQGLGGAGMVSLVSILLTDLVPMREVASLRSYINVLATTGRTCGGVIGGFLTQTLGWRWAFLVQLPPTVLALLLVEWKLNLPSKAHESKQTTRDRLKRIDFVGALLLCTSIFAGCLILDVGGQKVDWNSPFLIITGSLGALTLALFIFWSQQAEEPIFPIHLIAKYEVWTNYTIAMLSMTAQIALMMAVPLYVQATSNASVAEAGAYLIPAFIGNMIGGLTAGYWIKHTGRYKIPTVLSPILQLLTSGLCLIFWNGKPTILQSLFIFFGGAANGLVSSSSFVGLTAQLDEEEVGMAGSGLYLVFNIGSIAGTSLGSALYQTALKSGLKDALKGVDGKEQVIQKLLENIEYLRNLDDGMKRIVLPSYINSFHQVNVFSLCCGGIILLIAVFTRGSRLRKE